jgi:diguanylate cyclase (GGDEF)-like protein
MPAASTRTIDSQHCAERPAHAAARMNLEAGDACSLKGRAPHANAFDMRLTNERFARLDSAVPAKFPAWLAVMVAIGALLSIFQLDRTTGQAPVQHLYYLPILVAAVRLGYRAGLAAAAAAIVFYHLATPLAWPLRESDLVQIGLFIAVALVTARLADDARRLHQLAATDDLTGLHNLRSFESRFIPMVRSCRVAGLPIALLVLDLDRLKSLNDVHGHLAGGQAVQTLGHVLAARLPRDAVACRFGGDEFVIAIPDCTSVRAEAVANDIRRSIKALAPDLAGKSFPAGTLSVSVGVACLYFSIADAFRSSNATDLETGEALFRSADHSLYSAKDQGRNRVSVVVLSTAAIASSARDGAGGQPRVARSRRRSV